jgi:chain length determinant protein EpsF
MNTFTPRQAWLVLKARRRLAFGIFGGLVAAVFAGSLLWPRSYRGETSVIVDVANPDPITGNPTGAIVPSAYLSTQIDVIQSHSVALKVVDRLKLDEDPEVIAQFRKKTQGAGSLRDWIADAISKNIEVVPSRESSVLTIDCYSRQPQAAAALADAFTEAYIETDRELKVEAARRQAAWFQDENVELRRALEAAQHRLAEYQQTHSIVSNSPDRLDLENGRMAELTAQLVAAQAQAGDAQARLQQMRQALAKQQIDQLPDILGNPLLQSMKADLIRAEGKLADTGQRVGANHPQYMQAQAEVKELRQRLTAEVENLEVGIEQTAQIAQQRVSELQSGLDEQRNRIIQLQQRNDELDVLSRDVQSAQHTYEAAMQRTDSLRLESSDHLGTISVLDRAVVPLTPARPKLFLNLAIACVLGFLLSVSGVFLAERYDRRVRLSVDLQEPIELVVLAEIPGPFLPALEGT